MPQMLEHTTLACYAVTCSADCLLSLWAPGAVPTVDAGLPTVMACRATGVRSTQTQMQPTVVDVARLPPWIMLQWLLALAACQSL